MIGRPPLPGAEAPLVSFFIPSLQTGGSERVMTTLAAEFARRGRRVHVVSGTGEGALTRELPDTVTVVPLGGRRLVGCLLPLVRYLRRERPHTLLSSKRDANVIALLAARLARTGTATCVREANALAADAYRAGGVRGRMLPLLMRWTYPWARCVVAPSKGVRDALVGRLRLAGEHVHVIPNPVPVHRIEALAREPVPSPWPDNGGLPIVLAAGRLARQKDYPTLIRAFAAVRAGVPSRLLVLGEGPERGTLEALVERLGLGADVRFPGFVENPFAYMARASVFVLSSRWEGLPNTLIQAMACGCPVVSTDCPSGPREVLHDGTYGRLVPPRDPDALAAAILETLRHPAPPPPEVCRAYDPDTVTTAYAEAVLGSGARAGAPLS